MTHYAKPDNSLKGSYDHHISECYLILENVFKHRRDSIEALCSLCNIKLEDFKRKCCLAILLHDSGKLVTQFQKMMEAIINGKQIEKQLFFRHELWSTICILFVQSKVYKNIDHFPYEIFAVLGHHKSLDERWNSFKRERNWQFGEWPKLDKVSYVFAMSILKGICSEISDFREEEAEIVFANFDSNKLFTILDYLTAPTYLHEKEIDKKSTRQLYSIVKGMLHYCDWSASSEKEKKELNETPESLQNKIKAKVVSEGKLYESRPFHIKCRTERNDVIAIAPTGSGKTEAALLWALNQEYKKIIFLMPTMVTSNSLYKRMSSHYFDKDICGLSHSGAETYFMLNNENEDENNNESRFGLLQNKAFMPPLMVATVDQILTTGFNIGLWSHKEFALLGSSVVFDEIQAYDTYTIALITETIKRIKNLGGRVMIMSATMPNFLLNHFSAVLKIEKPIIADERMYLARNRWHYRDLSLNDLEKDIAQCMERNQKIAIVVNDIETAKKEFIKWQKIYGKKVMCYHSQFIMLDRIHKEQILTESQDDQIQLLIATQVIEVSLDISFDVMYSECAPLDSLIQRAGRCNRYGNKRDSEFIVFRCSDLSRKFVYKKFNRILDRTEEAIRENQKELNEKEISDMLNFVYSNFELYNNEYYAGKDLYDEIAHQCFIFDAGISDEKTRIFEYAKTSIIPQKFFEKVISLCDKKKFKEISLYEVPVSVGFFVKNLKKLKIENKYNLPIYEIGYSEDTGIINEFNTPMIW